VNPLTTVTEAEALAAWVNPHHRNPTTIYITHGHLDHFAGLSVLLRHFPDARVIATPKSVELTRAQPVAFYRRLLPGQLPAAITLPEPYPEVVFHLEGHELRLIEQGHTDAPDSTSLHVPSIASSSAGTSSTTSATSTSPNSPRDRRELDRRAGPAGGAAPEDRGRRAQKTDAPDTPEAIAWTKRYLADFSPLKQETSNDRELFDAMGRLYPDWAAHQVWLMFGLT
jgi:hypothetical protein